MRIRLAERADLPALAVLVAAAGVEMQAHGYARSDKLQLAAMQHGIDTGEAVVVAEQDGELLGFVAWAAMPLAPEGQVAGLGTYVVPSARRDRVSHYLRDFAADHARRLGHHTVRGEVALSNEAGRIAAERAGFRVVGLVIEKALNENGPRGEFPEGRDPMAGRGCDDPVTTLLPVSGASQEVR